MLDLSYLKVLKRFCYKNKFLNKSSSDYLL